MIRILNGLKETLFNIDDIFQHSSSQDQYKRYELDGRFPKFNLFFLIFFFSFFIFSSENIIQNHS